MYPSPLLHRIETTSKMPILPVLSIFVALFCSFPLLSTLYYIYLNQLLFSPSFLFCFICSFFCSFAPPLPSHKNKAKHFLPRSTFYYLLSLSLRPVPSKILIAQTISISRMRTKTKSQPMSNQPKKATINKMRIIPEQCCISSLDNIYNVPSRVRFLFLLFPMHYKTLLYFR